jgi:hypothetical protein
MEGEQELIYERRSPAIYRGGREGGEQSKESLFAGMIQLPALSEDMTGGTDSGPLHQ